MEKPMTSQFRKELADAMDARMTDEEAIVLIAEMTQLAVGLLKAAPPEDQESLMPKVIRCRNLVAYVSEAFSDRDNYHRRLLDKMEEIEAFKACRQ